MEKHIPHEIDFEVDAELNEELIHLTQIGGIAMGVKKGGGGHGIANVDGHDFCAAPRWELEQFHVLKVWEAAQCVEPC